MEVAESSCPHLVEVVEEVESCSLAVVGEVVAVKSESLVVAGEVGVAKFEKLMVVVVAVPLTSWVTELAVVAVAAAS